MQELYSWLLSLLPEFTCLVTMAIAEIVTRIKLKKTRNELELKRLELEQAKLDYARSTDTLFSKFIAEQTGGKTDEKKNEQESK